MKGRAGGRDFTRLHLPYRIQQTITSSLSLRSQRSATSRSDVAPESNERSRGGGASTRLHLPYRIQQTLSRGEDEARRDDEIFLYDRVGTEAPCPASPI